MYATNVRNLKRNPSEALRHAEVLIVELNKVGYRISAAVVA